MNVERQRRDRSVIRKGEREGKRQRERERKREASIEREREMDRLSERERESERKGGGRYNVRNQDWRQWFTNMNESRRTYE